MFTTNRAANPARETECPTLSPSPPPVFADVVGLALVADDEVEPEVDEPAEPPVVAAANVVWPKLALKDSHQSPKVVKSAVVFPASRLMVRVLEVDFCVTCVWETRNPSFNIPSVDPHQCSAGALASRSW